MNTNSKKNHLRPSDYLLSRYLLGECTQDEKETVEQWQRSSTEASAYFSKFQAAIKSEENIAPTSFTALVKSKYHGNKSGYLFSFYSSKPFKIALSLSCFLFVCAGLWFFIGNQNHQNNHQFQQRSASATWHDTLQTLFTITEDLLYSKDKVIQTADSFPGTNEAIGQDQFKIPRKEKPYGGLAVSDNVRIVSKSF
jgi:hypothetical protein